VKFRNPGVTNEAARLFVAKLTDGIAGTELEASSNAAADSGNTFRYDAAFDGAAATSANGRLVVISLRM
jgi:hypothetical protein